MTFCRQTFLAAALIACAAPALATDKVSIGALRFTSHAPTFIAVEKGYFKAENIDADIKFFQAAQPIAVAIASGDIDFGITALTGGYYSLAAKGAVKVIGGLYAEKKGVNGMAVMVSNKAYSEGITTPAKLKDRTVALTQVGSSFHYIAGMVAEANGFKLTDLKLKPLQKVGSMIGAVKSGQVDSMFMVPHVAIPLEKAGAAKIVGWVNELGPYQVTTIFTSTKNVKERAELVKRFMKAYKRAIADYNNVMVDQKKDPAATEAMTKLIHKYVYNERPYDKAAPGIKAGAVYMAEGGSLDVKNVEKQLKWNQEHKFAPASLTMEQLLAPGFADFK
ncbi:MAG: ABC transporter substrate-binding protein [Beijerinckiaceae bacterium]